MKWSETERAAMVASLYKLDPNGPTLCEGWNVRRLVAHLVQREHALGQQLRDVINKEAPGHETQLSKVVATATTPSGYQELVSKFAAGTGPLNPMSWLGDAGNLVEYVVHHEDALRGLGAEDTEAPDRPAAQLDKLFAQLRPMAKLSFRRSPVGVLLARADGSDSAIAKKGSGVTITGDPVELALYVSGRRDAAQVQIDGAAGHVAAFEQWLSAKH